MNTQENNQKEAPETLTGTVIEALPETMFKVLTEDGDEILTYLAGKMRMYRIKVLVGDKVDMKIDPYGGKARIFKRL
jgi:translation initiation factor IF-1